MTTKRNLPKNKTYKRTKLLVFICCFLFASCLRSGSGDLTPGDAAPAIELQLLDGSPLSLQELKGKVVLVNFWASWCAPCIMEMPDLKAIYRKLKERGFEILAIAQDESFDKIKEIVSAKNLDFPVLLDPKGYAKRAYKVRGFPETFLIDREGKLRFINDPETGLPEVRIMGPRNWSDAVIVTQIENILDSK